MGGYYFFTSDEVKIDKSNIYLIEGKHTKNNNLPASDDIKDGLLKMILFTNLKKVAIGRQDYFPVPVLKLTTGKGFDLETLKESQHEVLKLLKKEAKVNMFKIKINKDFL